jgi:4-amino-4-deoxy-L-arabinose transferase-like glycosyltransferase
MSKTTKTLFSIIILGLFLRILLSFIIGYKDMDTDALVYFGIAKGFINYHTFVEEAILFTPGYPFFISIVNIFIADTYIAAKFVSIFFGTLTIPIAYFTGKEFYNKTAGLFTAFAIAIYPGIAQTGAVTLTEATFFFFLFCSLYFSIRIFNKEKLKDYIFAGIFIAFAFLVRPEGLFLLIFPFIFTGYNVLKRKKINFLKLFSLFALFFIICSPYLIFIHSETGNWSLSGKGGWNIIYGEVVTEDPLEFREEYFSLNENKDQLVIEELSRTMSHSDYISNNLDKFSKRYFIHLLEYVNFFFFFMLPIVIPLFLFFFTKIRTKITTLTLFLYSLILASIYPMYVLHPRYTFIIIIPLILLSSVGFSESKNILKRWRFKKIITNNIKTLILVVLILSALLHTFGMVVERPYYVSYAQVDFDPDLYIDTSNAILDNINSEKRTNIISMSYHESYRTGSGFVSLPYTNDLDLIEFAKNREASFIIINERDLESWKYYESYTILDSLSPDVEKIYESEDSGYLRQIFKVKE